FTFSTQSASSRSLPPLTCANDPCHVPASCWPTGDAAAAAAISDGGTPATTKAMLKTSAVRLIAATSTSFRRHHPDGGFVLFGRATTAHASRSKLTVAHSPSVAFTTPGLELRFRGQRRRGSTTRPSRR